MMRANGARCAGFTLIETLAALALASIIVVAGSALLHQGLFTFDRGAETVDQEEELSLAITCLARDFAAARYVREKSLSGAASVATASPQIAAAGKVDFTGRVDEDGQAQVLFVTGGGRTASATGEEIVGLSVERGDTMTKLIRRRAPWPGPLQRVASATLKDPVVLLRGNLDIVFSYSELVPKGALIWRDRWTGKNNLPHSVRLALRDAVSGADLQSVEFLIRADAPAGCASGANECLVETPVAANGASQ